MYANDMGIKRAICGLRGSGKFVCVSRENKWYTYDEFWSSVIRIADQTGLFEQKEIVAVLENGLPLFLMYFACMVANTAIIPVDPRKSRKEIDGILSEYESATVLEDDSEITNILHSEGASDTYEINNYINGIDLNKTYLITFTSGSTGKAKGVKHSLKNLFLASNAFGEATGLGSCHIMSHVMPMTYMAGILNTIFMPFIRHSKIVLMPRFDVMSATSFWRTVEQFGITAFWLSPTMLNLLLTVDRKGGIKSYLDEKEALFFIGTAPLYQNTRDRFEDRYGVRLLQSYGLSETLFLSTEVPDKEGDFDSAGGVLENVDILFENDGGIKVRVPWMFQGYSNEESRECFDGDYYITGDLGKIENGQLYITGRKKDLIVKGGMNISPKQIEDCILKNQLVEECAVAGVAVNDEERIICWYIQPFIEEPHQRRINEFIENNLGRHCKIDCFINIMEMPKNLNGKIDKRTLIEEFKHDHQI